MKKLMLLVLVMPFALAPQTAFANIFSVSVDSSSTNIPISYSSSSASKILSNITNVRAIVCSNNTSTKVIINCSYGGSFVPTDTDNHNMYVPANGAIAIDQAFLAGTCYVRSAGSAISSGTLDLMLVGG